MKILIADTFEQTGIDELKRAGMEVVCEPGLKDDALTQAIGRTGCNVLVVRSTRVTEPMLQVGDSLDLVVRAGAGFNTIDVQAASRRSIMVANCPGKNAVAVAELTMALILALDRRVVENVVDLRAGKWNKSEYSKSAGLKGRTLGIIGLGEIGRAVADRARGFEMKLVGWSRSLTDEFAAEIGLKRYPSPGDVAEAADVLTIHLASNKETAGMIGGDVFQRMRPGACLINTARSEVMDYGALAKAIKERHLRVGLDVYSTEPSTGVSEFADQIVHAGSVVYGTHHIGASTQQAQDAIAAETVRIIKTFERTGRVLHCVNVRQPIETECSLRVRHVNKPGVLAHVLGQLSRAGINVDEMENVITTGNHAACAHLRIDAEPSDEILRRIESESEHILSVSATHL